MSIIQELGHFKLNFSDLPIWAALVVAVCIGSFMTMGTMSLITETRLVPIWKKHPYTTLSRGSPMNGRETCSWELLF